MSVVDSQQRDCNCSLSMKAQWRVIPLYGLHEMFSPMLYLRIFPCTIPILAIYILGKTLERTLRGDCATKYFGALHFYEKKKGLSGDNPNEADLS